MSSIDPLRCFNLEQATPGRNELPAGEAAAYQPGARKGASGHCSVAFEQRPAAGWAEPRLRFPRRGLVRADRPVGADLRLRSVEQFTPECFAYRLGLLDVLVGTRARRGVGWKRWTQLLVAHHVGILDRAVFGRCFRPLQQTVYQLFCTVIAVEGHARMRLARPRIRSCRVLILLIKLLIAARPASASPPAATTVLKRGH